MTGIYDWNYTGIVNSEENEKNGEENTDDEDFVRTSSNSNECDDVTALDKCVVVVLVLLAECNEDKKFWKGFLFSCQYLVWNLIREKWLMGKYIWRKATNRTNNIGEKWLSFSQVTIFFPDFI